MLLDDRVVTPKGTGFIVGIGLHAVAVMLDGHNTATAFPFDEVKVIT